MSKECACGVCDHYDHDYEVFDDEGRQCCKCREYTAKCFPAAGGVFLNNGKLVKMSELQVGDRVQTGMKSVTMSELQVGDRVQTGIKSVTMSELQIGDRVQTGMNSVRMFHRYLTYFKQV